MTTYRRWALLPRPQRFAAKLAAVVVGGAAVWLIGMPIVAETFVALVLVDTYLVFGLRRGRAPARLGFARDGAISQTGLGFALGASMMTLVIAVFAVAGWYRVAGVGSSWGGVAYGFAIFLPAAVVEEVFARGMLFRFTERIAGSWAGLSASALIFGLLHFGNPNSGLLPSLAIALEAGVMLAAAYMAAGNLWFPIGIHWAWNVFEGPVYGTAVSGMERKARIVESVTAGPSLWTGGSFGPEAGLVAVIVGTAAGAGLLFAAARAGRFVGFAQAARRRVVPAPAAAAEPPPQH